MRSSFGPLTRASGTAMVIASIGWVAPTPTSAQAPSASQPYQAPRTEDGRPDLNGIWQALNTAAWDIQDHSGQLGVPAGRGVVEDNEIPYQPWALEKKRQNFANRMTADPVRQCFLPGVPRATYMPFPFEIAQSPEMIAVMHEYVHAQRIIPLDGRPHSPVLEAGFDFWMGDSRGHWEGDTLVVDVRGFNDQTWFDEAGNFHSDALHVVERYTRTGPDHLFYEATIEDPKVFTRPWKMSMPLYRRVEQYAELFPYDCYIYLQEKQFGPVPVGDTR